MLSEAQHGQGLAEARRWAPEALERRFTAFFERLAARAEAAPVLAARRGGRLGRGPSSEREDPARLPRTMN